MKPGDTREAGQRAHEGLRPRGSKTVLLVSHNSNLSGAPISLAQLARALPETGWQPLYVLPKKGPVEQLLKQWGVEYLLLNGRSPVLDFIRVVRRTSPAIVHVNSLVNSWPVLVSRLLGKKVVWHVREHLGRKRLYARLIHLISHRVILISQAQGRLFDRLPRARVVPNGIDLSLYRDAEPAPDIEAIRATARTIVACIGTIEPRKGLMVLAQAAGLLRECPWIHFLVAGDEKEGGSGYKKQVQDFLRAGGLGDRFHFLGVRKDVPAVLAASDALCHPAFIEVFPRTILEAMASGLPVISTRTGGIPEMVSEGSTGFLFDPGDSATLAATIKKIDGDRCLGEQMGARGFSRAAAEFTLERHAGMVASIYQELTCRGDGASRRSRHRGDGRMPRS